MYTVSKGPSKLVAKTRRGIPQSYEKYELIRDLGRNKNTDCENNVDISVPRPVFQTTKKAASQYFKAQQQLHQQQYQTEETLSPQHEEIIKYIYDSWNMVVAANPYDVPDSPNSTTSSTTSLSSTNSTLSSTASSTSSTSSLIYYVDTPSQLLSDFKPFDLESWWGRRLFNNITKSL
uniref:Protein aael aael000663 aedes aegypti n=1 Tax=Corethrella appendiculata TaxID=1370023 RepID=U5EYY1_9DIPT